MTQAVSHSSEDLKTLATDVEALRSRINNLRLRLGDYFVEKQEIIDLMCVCMLAQEPLLILGKPGTAKSDLVVKFSQALGLQGNDYFEYMLTKFTEPSEIIGPIDVGQLKHGRYWRKVGGKLPECRIAFLDEIFKSNSAILNTLLTIINERKFYQDGQPTPVNLVMLFAAANEIPEHEELAALRDRFILKVESHSVRDTHFEGLVDKGLRNEMFRAFNQRPWENLATLEDFIRLKTYLDHTIVANASATGEDGEYSDPAYPANVFALFKRILKALAVEDRLEISDRKVVKLYKLIRARALLFHGGVVVKDDLCLLRYIPNRIQDFAPVADKVNTLLRL